MAKTIEQLLAELDRKTYFNFDEEARLNALDSAADSVYKWIIHEQQNRRGMFMVIDSSTVALVANTEEYTLPADCRGPLFRVRVRRTANEEWQQIMPAQELTNLPDLGSITSDFWSGPRSDFRYFGPYLDNVAIAAGAQVFKMRVTPIAKEAHLVELAYPAARIEIKNSKSKVPIPDDASYALLFQAAAELVEEDDNDLAGKYEGRARRKLSEYLMFMRDGQLQQVPQVELYMDPTE